MKFLLCALLLWPVFARAETNLAASGTFEVGKAFPQSNLADFLADGTAYRVDLFGGAKLQQIKFLSAIGLGLDATYTVWRPKNAEAGFRYKQIQWDMFKLPISLWYFVLEPGILWMITDVQIPHLGIDQTSIRPGLNFNLGFRLPLLPHFNLRADARVQRVMMDKERTLTREEVNITGQTYSWFGGFELYF